MNWIGNWLLKKLRQSIAAEDDANQPNKNPNTTGGNLSSHIAATQRKQQSSIVTGESIVNSEAPLQILVHNAVGGKIVEVQVRQRVQAWEVRADAPPPITVYLVPDDADFGVELGKIISLEFLKHG